MSFQHFMPYDSLGFWEGAFFCCEGKGWEWGGDDGSNYESDVGIRSVVGAGGGVRLHRLIMQRDVVVHNVYEALEPFGTAAHVYGRSTAQEPLTRRRYENQRRFSSWSSWIAKTNAIKCDFAHPNVSRWSMGLSPKNLNTRMWDMQWWWRCSVREG